MKNKDNGYKSLIEGITGTVALTLFSVALNLWDIIGAGLKPDATMDYYVLVLYAVVVILLVSCLICLKKKKDYAGVLGLIASAVLLEIGDGLDIWLACINIAECTLYLAPSVYPSLKKDTE